MIAYDTAEQLKAILEIIKKHNSAVRHPEFVRLNSQEEFKQLESGEPLEQLVTYEVKKAYKSPRSGPALSHVLMCAQGGGRSLTLDFLEFELLRAFPDVHVGGFHALQVYPHELSIFNRLIRKSEAVLGDDVVKSTYTNEKDWLVQPAVYTTREAAGNPAFTELLSGLYGNERKKRMREERDTPAYLQTFTSETNGFVVGDKVFAERAEAEARSQKIKNEYKVLQKRHGNYRADEEEKALNRARYESLRASGKRYYTVTTKSTHGDHPDAKRGAFWLTAAQWAAMRASDWLGAESGESMINVTSTSRFSHLKIDEIDEKIAAGEQLAINDIDGEELPVARD